jgi:hypothetical protein
METVIGLRNNLVISKRSNKGMNLNTLEKVARQVLTGKVTNTVNSQLTSSEQRALASQSWKITPGGAAAGTYAMYRPMSAWG